MDIEQLEKLNELKEKGLLTQEEFDKQKKALLTPEAANKAPVKNKKGASWKNLGKSFIITVLWCFAIGFIAYMFGFVVDDSNKESLSLLLCFLSAIGLAMIASELETKKYKHYFSAFGIFFFSFVLGPLGVWIAFYQFLQIKQGNAILEEVKTNE